MHLPLGKKSSFGQNTNILLKASNRISVSENDPLRQFLGSQGSFRTSRDPKGHKRVKNADFKI